MQAAITMMRTAMRVLVAVIEEQRPNPVDVARLRASVPNVGEDVPLDEMACEAIQQALRDRAKRRLVSGIS